MRQNLRRDMSDERLMELGMFSIVGDHDVHKQILPTPFQFPPGLTEATITHPVLSFFIRNVSGNQTSSEDSRVVMCSETFEGKTWTYFWR
jgi:hypothetical protein